MMRGKTLWGIVLLLGMMLLPVGCARETPIPPDTALVIEGLVGKPQALNLDALRSMEQVQAMAPCTDSGRDKEFKGPALNALLDLAKLKSKATEIVFTGDEGYTAVLALDAVRETTDAIIAVTPKGKCRLILPGQLADKQVLGLTTITLR